MSLPIADFHNAENLRYFLISPLFAAIANTVLAVFIFSRGPKVRLNQIFFLWGISLVLWNAGAFLLFIVKDPDAALVIARGLEMGVILIPATALHLCQLISGVKANTLLRVGYVITFLLMGTNFTSLFIVQVRQVTFGWFAVAGPGFWVYSTLVPILSLPAIFLLFKKMRTSGQQQRRKYTTLLMANSLLLIVGTHDLAPVLGYDFYPGTQTPVLPWGTFASGIYGLLVAYGVFQDQILDVRVALGRHAALGLRVSFFLALCILGLVIAALIIPSRISVAAILAFVVVLVVAAGISAVFFPKLFGESGLGETLERKILGDSFEYQEQVRLFITSLQRYSDSAELVDDTVRALRESMELTSVHIIVLSLNSSVIENRSSLPINTPFSQIYGDSKVIEFLRISKELIVDLKNPPVFLSRKSLEFAAREEAGTWGTDLIFSLRVHDEVLGLMAVGNKKNHSSFTSLDIELLSKLSRRMGWVLDRIRLAKQAVVTEKLELMSIMTRGLAHDIRNLLTPISTHLQLTTLRHNDDAEERELNQKALRNMDTILAYIKDAIFFADTSKLQFSMVECTTLFNSVVELTKPRADRLGVVVVASPWEGSLKADLTLIQRMLCNLVENAIDASPSGSTVELVAKPDGESAWIIFSIIDQGCGIPPENLDKVFHPYFTTKDHGDKIRGFGLGLSTVLKISHLHQGTINIKSVVGSGTHVRVGIPTSPIKDMIAA